MENLLKNLAIITFSIISLSNFSCKIFQMTGSLDEQNKEFLSVDKDSPELFKVLISSDSYNVAQMKYDTSINRTNDPGGDKYICEQLKKFDKINEIREGIIKIWLYPDNGRLMKVRPMKLTYLLEIDNLIVEDVQRWNFTFPKNIVTPDHFEIKYRVILRKKQTDEQIMKEIRDDMKNKNVTR